MPKTEQVIGLGALAFAAILIVIGGGIAGGAHLQVKPHAPAYMDFPAWLLSVPAIIWVFLLVGVLTGYGASFLVALGWAIIWLPVAITWICIAQLNNDNGSAAGASSDEKSSLRMVVAGWSLQVCAIFIAFLALFPWGTLKKMAPAYLIDLLGWIVAFIGAILYWDLNRKSDSYAAGVYVSPSVEYFVMFTAAFFAVYTVSPHAHGAAAVLLGFVMLSACNDAFNMGWQAKNNSKYAQEQMAGILMIIIGAFFEGIAVILVVGRTVVASDEVAGHDHAGQPGPEGVPLQNTAGQGVAGV